MCKIYPDHPEDDQCIWVPSEAIEEFLKQGWILTEETRMGYAIPAWLKGLDLTKKTIFLADDANRANPAILQALMEVCDKQEYISWKLPAKTTVILSLNPEDQGYNVSSFDEAQKTRFVTFRTKFDVEC